MMKALLARKLLMYVLYSGVVTALPLSSHLAPRDDNPRRNACECQASSGCSIPLVQVESEKPSCSEMNAAYPLAVREDYAQPDRWWCRGPVRRAVRAVACFVSRPWRR